MSTLAEISKIWIKAKIWAENYIDPGIYIEDCAKGHMQKLVKAISWKTWAKE